MNKQYQYKRLETKSTDYMDDISFSNILLIIASNIKIILIIPIILCSATIIYVLFIAEPVFVSSSKIMPSSNENSANQAIGLAAQFGISLPSSVQGNSTSWAYPEIIKSRKLARIMLDRTFTTNEFGNNKKLVQILTHGNEEPDVGDDTLKIIATETFLGMIGVSEDIKSGVMTINVSAKEPLFAKKLISAIIEEVDRLQNSYNKEKTSETRKFIEDRINTTRNELERAEENLKNFAASNRRIENSPSLQLENQRLSREVAVLTGVFTTLKQQLETTKIEEVKESNYVVVIDPPNIPLKPIKPKKKSMVILSGLVGLLLGFVVSLFADYYKTLKTEKKDDYFRAFKIAKENIFNLTKMKKVKHG